VFRNPDVGRTSGRRFATRPDTWLPPARASVPERDTGPGRAAKVERTMTRTPRTKNDEVERREGR